MQKVEEVLQKADVGTFLTAFNASLDPIVVTDTNLDEGVKILFVNDAFCKTTGYSKAEVLGKNPKILQGRDSDQKTLRRLKRTLKAGKDFTGQTVNYRKDGSDYVVQWSVSALRDTNGEPVAYFSTQKILTRLEKIEDEKVLFQSVVKQAPGMILVTNIEGIIVYVNDAFVNNIGYSRSELVGQHSRMLKSGKQGAKFYERMWQELVRHGKFEDVFISQRKDGSLFYDKKKITTIKDKQGNPKYYLAVSYDITQTVETEQDLRDKLFTDQLTKTFNRKKYEKTIKSKITAFKQSDNRFSLILFDIDHFKTINDTHGHQKGDTILKELAKLTQQNLRKNEDMLFRWGGEEFAVITDAPLQQAILIAQKLRKTIETHDFTGMHVTASFGVAAIAPDISAKQLFEQADNALYEAKEQGRNRVITADPDAM